MSGAAKPIRVALAGNPNAGKTTLFNALTGAHHKVGNYPGVTVEKREGRRERDGREYLFIDLPGIYSLSAYSLDEVVARDFLLDEKPDLIVDVLDSSNLERHLYLCLQFQELGIPVVGALNMSDEAEAKGILIDAKALSAVLGLPFVKTVGSKGRGVEEILDAIDAMPSSGGLKFAGDGRALRMIRYGEEIEAKLLPLEGLIAGDPAFAAKYPARWMAVKLLEKDANALERLAGHEEARGIADAARASIAWIEKHYGKDAETVFSEQRYGYIRGAVKESIKIARRPDFSLSERVDRVVMQPVLALPIFFATLWAVFQLTFALGAFPMSWMEAGFAALSGALQSSLSEGILRSFLVDAVVGGVGGVLSFVPLIVILFFLLSVLEDVGYMARAAFATDKFLHAFGLHGQSVLPMILGFGCSVPAIMAARTLKSPKDRVLTILTIPFMSCGAKLPVHVLLAGAFFPGNEANMVMLIYASGVVLALLSSLFLKRVLLRGEPSPFVMELPPYRRPTLRGLAWHVGEKTLGYAKKAGTVILFASVLVWAMTSFPGREPRPGEDARESAKLQLEGSAAGIVGKAIQPLFAPLGFDWKISVATVTGFAAKEVVVSTLGVLSGAGDDESLRESLRRESSLGPLAAFGLMLFMLVIPPCFAALAAIKAEIGWKWTGFAVAYLFALGWILAFALKSIGGLFPA